MISYFSICAICALLALALFKEVAEDFCLTIAQAFCAFIAKGFTKSSKKITKIKQFFTEE
jgi:hypothetical protein